MGSSGVSVSGCGSAVVGGYAERYADMESEETEALCALQWADHDSGAMEVPSSRWGVCVC